MRFWETMEQQYRRAGTAVAHVDDGAVALDLQLREAVHRHDTTSKLPGKQLQCQQTIRLRSARRSSREAVVGAVNTAASTFASWYAAWFQVWPVLPP